MIISYQRGFSLPPQQHIQYTPTEEWSYCNRWYLTLRRVVYVFLELLVSHHEKIVHGLPGTVGISPWEEWCMVFLELLLPLLERVVFLELLVRISLLRIVVILELLVSHHEKVRLSATVAMKSCNLTLRRQFLQPWGVVFLDILLSHLKKTYLPATMKGFLELLLSQLGETDLPATMKHCLTRAVAVSPWEGWSSCNYEALSAWSCCYLTLRRLISLQL